MSDDEGFDGPAGPPAVLADSLGYLVKHAQLRLGELTAAELAPLEITGRELAVLRVIDSMPLPSQQEIAARMAVDRTTMVSLIDGLQDKGLLRRRQVPQDRRKNAVVLTDAGQQCLRKATPAAQRAEQAFLAPLAAAEMTAFRAYLRAVCLIPAPGNSANQEPAADS